MAAKRKPDLHETGDAKMKAAAVKSVQDTDPTVAVPSPAKELQDKLQAHYAPLSRRMSVILVSFLVAFAFIGGWLGNTAASGFA